MARKPAEHGRELTPNPIFLLQQKQICLPYLTQTFQIVFVYTFIECLQSVVLIFKLYSSKNNNCGYSNASCAVQGILSSKICVICFTRCFKTKSYFCEKHHIFETFSLLLLVLVWYNRYIFDKKILRHSKKALYFCDRYIKNRKYFFSIKEVTKIPPKIQHLVEAFGAFLLETDNTSKILWIRILRENIIFRPS